MKSEEIVDINDNVNLNNTEADNNDFLRKFELLPEELSWRCPEELLNFDTTEELPAVDKIIGQPRAIEAIRLGAELRSKGYNIFVSE